MTVIVGVRCTDGIVIGADSVATSSMGPMPLMRVGSNDKIRIYENLVISAASGSVGYTQRLNNQVEAAVRGGIFRGQQKVNESVGNISRRFITDLESTHAQRHPHHGIGFTALVGAVINNEPYLVEYDPVNFQPEIKDGRLFYVSIGSGQNLADPFLAFVSRVLWNNAMPSVDVAKFGVLWALQHTIRHAAMGVGGEPLMAVLTKLDNRWVAKYMSEDDMQETVQHTDELETYISQFAVTAIRDAPTQQPPRPPEV